MLIPLPRPSASMAHRPHAHQTWADVNVPGWSCEHTGGWTKYGSGWNVYLTHQEGHFCAASYFGCVQNKYPWIEDDVGPGGGTQYMHSGG